MVNSLIVVDSPTDGPTSPAANPLRARKLSVAHFAFMRALVQGLDPEIAWNRYMFVEGDYHPKRKKRMVDWLRNEFAIAARREGRHGAARLLLIDIQNLPQPIEPIPNLETFAASKGLTEFTEKEQLHYYNETYGSVLKFAQRQARLMTKQQDIVRQIEVNLAQPPLPGDALACWFSAEWVQSFEQFGVYTLKALIDRINSVPHRWWKGMKSIGAEKAARIEFWLLSNERTLRQPLRHEVYLRHPNHRPIVSFTDAFGQHYQGGVAGNRLVARQTDIVPLDRFLVPEELDGSRGRFRAPNDRCLIDARNDRDAILTWVRSKHGLTPAQQQAIRKRREPNLPILDDDPAAAWAWLNELSHTQRAYIREAERFYLWAIIERRKALSDLTVEDCTAYRNFLSDPTPDDRWCGKRNARRGTPAWRPFEGPLSIRAQNHTIDVLRNLFTYLVDQGYLTGNAWKGVETPRHTGAKINAGRSFTMAQWDYINNELNDLSENISAHLRLRVALRLLYGTGIRREELVNAKLGDLTWVEYASDAHDQDTVQGWLLNVVGKGDKPREVTVPEDVITDLKAYLKHRGLAEHPAHPSNKNVYLMGQTTDLLARAPWAAKHRDPVDATAGITAGTLYEILKRFFAECSKKMAKNDEAGAERLKAGSTHWLRHTHASHWIARDTPIEIAQQNLGHASLHTTTIYVTTEKKRRMKANQGAWQKGRVAR